MQMQTYYTVRFNDCDPFGHLNNSRYIDYMLNAREDHLSQFYKIELGHFHKQGYGWVVTNHEIQYIRPAAYNEKVCIQSELIEAGDSHLLVEMRMYDEAINTLKTILWTKFTCVNMKTSRKEIHPEDFMHIANSMLVRDVKIEDGLKGRVTEFFRKKQVMG
jgi:YbgC/YbaW family acyl-CoA thioester hydrolase